MHNGSAERRLTGIVHIPGSGTGQDRGYDGDLRRRKYPRPQQDLE